MAYEKKNFDFVLFINQKKSGTSPDVSGNIYINGEEIALVGWKRTTSKGIECYSGCKGRKQEKSKEEQNDGWETHNTDYEIPF